MKIIHSLKRKWDQYLVIQKFSILFLLGEVFKYYFEELLKKCANFIDKWYFYLVWTNQRYGWSITYGSYGGYKSQNNRKDSNWQTFMWDLVLFAFPSWILKPRYAVFLWFLLKFLHYTSWNEPTQRNL